MNILESGIETGAASMAEQSNTATGYIECLTFHLPIKNSATCQMNILELDVKTGAASMAERSNAVTYNK